MPHRYQDTYPERSLIESRSLARPSAADLLTLEYFEAEPDSMPEREYAQHHILLNYQETPHRVENWRDGEHRDFTYHHNEIVVTPAGMVSGWRWYIKSKVIVITLEPEKLERFAKSELGVLLTAQQLKDLPQFTDVDICQAGWLLKEALETRDIGSEVMFESLARVFLIKLIQKYGERDAVPGLARGFTANHYKRVLDFVSKQFGRTITLEDLAGQAALSPSHFSRLFKQTVGQSPMQFVMSYRVEQAKKMLVASDRQMIEIALACGFSDQAHFSRVFKQVAGAPPKTWRATQAI